LVLTDSKGWPLLGEKSRGESVCLASGVNFANVSILKRFTEITTWKGKVDGAFLTALKGVYARRLLEMAEEKTNIEA
jgi:hypothetical protein